MISTGTFVFWVVAALLLGAAFGAAETGYRQTTKRLRELVAEEEAEKAAELPAPPPDAEPVEPTVPQFGTPVQHDEDSIAIPVVNEPGRMLIVPLADTEVVVSTDAEGLDDPEDV